LTKVLENRPHQDKTADADTRTKVFFDSMPKIYWYVTIKETFSRRSTIETSRNLLWLYGLGLTRTVAFFASWEATILVFSIVEITECLEAPAACQ
jgi:hypothetical protein